MKQNLSSYCFAVVREPPAHMLIVLLSVHEKTFGRPQDVQCEIVAGHFVVIAGRNRLADLFLLSFPSVIDGLKMTCLYGRNEIAVGKWGLRVFVFSQNQAV